MEVRQLEANEFEQAIQLANDTFREQGHTSIGDLNMFYPALPGQ